MANFTNYKPQATYFDQALGAPLAVTLQVPDNTAVNDTYTFNVGNLFPIGSEYQILGVGVSGALTTGITYKLGSTSDDDCYINTTPPASFTIQGGWLPCNGVSADPFTSTALLVWSSPPVSTDLRLTVTLSTGSCIDLACQIWLVPYKAGTAYAENTKD